MLLMLRNSWLLGGSVVDIGHIKTGYLNFFRIFRSISSFSLPVLMTFFRHPQMKLIFPYRKIAIFINVTSFSPFSFANTTLKSTYKTHFKRGKSLKTPEIWALLLWNMEDVNNWPLRNLNINRVPLTPLNSTKQNIFHMCSIIHQNFVMFYKCWYWRRTKR